MPRRRVIIPSALVVAFMMLPVSAAAQLYPGGSDSNFGSESLSAGFLPDPHTVSVTSGGSVDVRDAVGQGCRGHAASRPDFILHWSGDSDFLGIFFEGDGDGTLVINDPRGDWVCDDDSHTGLDPKVEITDPPTGQYDIWVGSYSSGEYIDGTLSITELRGVASGSSSNAGSSSSSGGELVVGGSDSHFGSESLSAGFLPDPHTVSVTSGGSVNARDAAGSDCRGYVARSPDYILHWSGPSDFLSIFFEGDGDGTLVINDPRGDWVCDDDSHTGLDPKVEITDPPTGQYDIWVGSYSSGEYIDGTLSITELRGVASGSSSNAGSSSSSGGELVVGGSDSNFGSESLSAGFLPDPHTVSVTSGGSVDVRDAVGQGCRGHAASRPDFILHWSGDSDFLGIFFEGDGDGTLVINDPRGDWVCDDDSHTGLDPKVEITDPPTGQYDIWVGSYSSGEYIDGTLSITELRGVASGSSSNAGSSSSSGG
ncbi:MAG: hypothetical protein ACOC8B_03490, partial [Gemmatimonadota bacterium]